MLPTPTKSHYTFNMRDLSKVFQGMLMINTYTLYKLSDLLRLWYHEYCRVFQDRLVNDEDRNWLHERLVEQLKLYKVNSISNLNIYTVLSLLRDRFNYKRNLMFLG